MSYILPTSGLPPMESTTTVTGLPGGTATPSLAPPSAATTHKIQQGDMLSTIARKYNVSVKALQNANPGIDPTHLRINSIIKIPASTPVAAAPRATTPASGRTVVTASTTIKPGTTYKVKKGDTLTTIAKAAYGSGHEGVRKIFQANRGELTDPNVVPVGTEIVIPR
jgi:LysM repeat protein